MLHVRTCTYIHQWPNCQTALFGGFAKSLIMAGKDRPFHHGHAPPWRKKSPRSRSFFLLSPRIFLVVLSSRSYDDVSDDVTLLLMTWHSTAVLNSCTVQLYSKCLTLRCPVSVSVGPWFQLRHDLSALWDVMRVFSMKIWFSQQLCNISYIHQAHRNAPPHYISIWNRQKIEDSVIKGHYCSTKVDSSQGLAGRLWLCRPRPETSHYPWSQKWTGYIVKTGSNLPNHHLLRIPKEISTAAV